MNHEADVVAAPSAEVGSAAPAPRAWAPSPPAPRRARKAWARPLLRGRSLPWTASAARTRSHDAADAVRAGTLASRDEHDRTVARAAALLDAHRDVDRRLALRGLANVTEPRAQPLERRRTFWAPFMEVFGDPNRDRGRLRGGRRAPYARERRKHSERPNPGDLRLRRLPETHSHERSRRARKHVAREREARLLECEHRQPVASRTSCAGVAACRLAVASSGGCGFPSAPTANDRRRPAWRATAIYTRGEGDR